MKIEPKFLDKLISSYEELLLLRDLPESSAQNILPLYRDLITLKARSRSNPLNYRINGVDISRNLLTATKKLLKKECKIQAVKQIREKNPALDLKTALGVVNSIQQASKLEAV